MKAGGPETLIHIQAVASIRCQQVSVWTFAAESLSGLLAIKLTVGIATGMVRLAGMAVLCQSEAVRTLTVILCFSILTEMFTATIFFFTPVLEAIRAEGGIL
jgi:hypothetical protein